MRLAALALALFVATPALANHPGEDLNQVMAAKEAAFESVEPRSAPEVAWKDGFGNVVKVGELDGKIVAVSFVPTDCGKPCSDQQGKLAKTLASLNASPMREMVEFVTLSNEEDGAPDALKNWTLAQVPQGQSVNDFAAAFAVGSNRSNETPMIHLLNREGQQVGIFHGSEFRPLNLVLYINGLTNAHAHDDPGLFERLFWWLP